MIRTTRKLTLTDTGKTLYDRFTALLADWEETETAASNAQAALAGKIRIAAPSTFGITHLGPAIIDFMQQHPKLDFDIDFSDRKIDLITEGMDLAIRGGELSDSSLIARKIANISIVAAASPAYLERHGMPQTPEDLKAHKELRFGYRASPIWPYKSPDGIDGKIEISPRLQATNGEFLRDAAIAGQGIILQPSFIIYKNLKDGSLTEILPGYKWPKISAYAVYPPTRHLSVRVRAFVDFLIARYKGTPYWEK